MSLLGGQAIDTKLATPSTVISRRGRVLRSRPLTEETVAGVWSDETEEGAVEAVDFVAIVAGGVFFGPALVVGSATEGGYLGAAVGLADGEGNSSSASLSTCIFESDSEASSTSIAVSVFTPDASLEPPPLMPEEHQSG